MQVGVVGAGSWGTALAWMLARSGSPVRLYGRPSTQLDSMMQDRVNQRYMPDLVLPTNVEVRAIGDWESEDALLLAVPTAGMRSLVKGLPDSVGILFLASKGLESVSAKLLSEVVTEERPDAVVGAISGPNLASEIVRGIPTATLSACANESIAREIGNALKSPTFRAYYSDDVTGVELAGALKNVFAIGAGISDGLGFGDNTKGALLARGLREMATLGSRMGARIETFFGIAGVGDLFATANSRLSRNYRVGFAVGQGVTLEAALAELGQVAEGVQTSRCVAALTLRYGVELPIMQAIDQVLHKGLPARDAVGMLMEREPQRERIAEPSASVSGP